MPDLIKQVANLKIHLCKKLDLPAAKRFLSYTYASPAFLILLIICIFVPQTDAKKPLFEKNVRIVAIDPGHGGNDTGAKGPNGVLEKTVALNLARMIAEQLEAKYSVVMTRSDDYGLEISSRTSLANHVKADIFISLHTGSSFIHNISGSTVYFYEPFQATALATEPTTPEPLADSPPVVIWDNIQTKYRVSSEKLAKLIQSQLFEIHQPPNTKVQGAPLLVLKGADMPGAVIEIGNLSNANSEKDLGDTQFLARIASGVAKGIEVFFRETPE